jgi:hypothetical protein
VAQPHVTRQSRTETWAAGRKVVRFGWECQSCPAREGGFTRKGRSLRSARRHQRTNRRTTR